MCKGVFFDGSPYVFATVLFPAHYRKAKETPPFLTFLIDTGADTTMINSIDAERLGITYRASVPFFGKHPLEEAMVVRGVGGEIKTYIVEDVMLILKTSLDSYVEFHTEHLDHICIPEGGVIGIPNLLGRDILNLFDISYNNTKEFIDLSRVPISGSGYAVYLD